MQNSPPMVVEQPCTTGEEKSAHIVGVPEKIVAVIVWRSTVMGVAWRTCLLLAVLHSGC